MSTLTVIDPSYAATCRTGSADPTLPDSVRAANPPGSVFPVFHTARRGVAVARG